MEIVQIIFTVSFLFSVCDSTVACSAFADTQRDLVALRLMSFFQNIGILKHDIRESLAWYSGQKRFISTFKEFKWREPDWYSHMRRRGVTKMLLLLYYRFLSDLCIFFIWVTFNDPNKYLSWKPVRKNSKSEVSLVDWSLLGPKNAQKRVLFTCKVNKWKGGKKIAAWNFFFLVLSKLENPFILFWHRSVDCELCLFDLHS